MIKIIAFDLVGVLAREKQIELSYEEDKLERLFGPNKSDEEFIAKGKELLGENTKVLEIANNIIDKLYTVREEKVFERLKELYPSIDIVIATNHISLIKKFIEETYNTKLLRDVVVSADIHKIKPDTEFYIYLLEKYNIKPGELLFLDDSLSNVEAAKSIGINTIKVERDMSLVEEIKKYTLDIK